MRPNFQNIFADRLPAATVMCSTGDRQSKRDGRRKRRDQEAEEILFEESVEPKESVILSCLEVEKKCPSTVALLATASAIGGFSRFLKRRKATLVEQFAAASFTPGCVVGLLGGSLVNPLVRL